jgi:hypothetical protein
VKRRVFLAALLGGGLAATSRSAAPAAASDYRLQREVLRTHELLSQARTTYQSWLSGRLGTPAALRALGAFEQPLRKAQAEAARWSSAADAVWLGATARQQMAELSFFRAQLRRPPGRQDLGKDLQQRWLTELDLRRSWLQARRQRLPVLLREKGLAAEVQRFYGWQARALELQVSELDLAEELARSFRDSTRPVEGWPQRGLRLHERAVALGGSGFLASAQQALEGRFIALSRLCQSARQYRIDPGSDSAANLQEDEKAFQALALRSEQVALETLRKVLRIGA